MNVKNHIREGEVIENTMSIIAGIDIKTIKTLRKKNLIPRSCYRMTCRGSIYKNESYVYKVAETLEIIERLRNEGIINKRRKRKEV